MWKWMCTCTCACVCLGRGADGRKQARTRVAAREVQSVGWHQTGDQGTDGPPEVPAGLLPPLCSLQALDGQGVAHHSAVVCFPQSLLV